MRYFKIFQIIAGFNKEELEEFEDFINSPYFSKSRDYSPILKTIYSFSNNWNKLSEITNEEFYAKIFPGISYSKKTLSNRINELTILAKKFIVQKSLEKDSSLGNLLLLKGLREKNLFDLFTSEITKSETISDKNKTKSYVAGETMMQSIHLYREKQDFDKMFAEYKKYTDYMIILFLENYFEMLLEYETQKQYNINLDFNIAYGFIDNLKMDKFIKILEDRNDPAFLVSILSYYLYRSYADKNNEEIYKKFSDIFFKNLDNLLEQQKNEFLGMMISRYFDKIASGKPEYLKEVFKLYNIKLKLGIYQELKFIRYPSLAYRDYIIVGLRLKKYKWVENFIKKYSIELPAEIRDNEVNMAYARLYFFKKEYNNSLESLGKMKTSNYIYLLDASRIKLRIMYETLKFEEAFLEIDRIKHFIRNSTKKIPVSVRNYSKEFLDIYNILLKLKLNPYQKDIGFFSKSVSKSSTLINKDWFVEMIKELKTNS